MLEPLTPLGHSAPETTTIGPVTITERTDTALASLAIRLGRAADVAAIAHQFGIPLPKPGHHATDTLSAFWLAPDMWMIEAPFATHEDIRAHLLQHFNDAASITEQTDAWVRFDVSWKKITGTRITIIQKATVFDRRAQLNFGGGGGKRSAIAILS